MPRPERIVVPGLPHHITHRGNRREVVFCEQEDYRIYLRLLRKATERFELKLWSYSRIAEIQDWSGWLAGIESTGALRRLREWTQRWHPCGSNEFVALIRSGLAEK